MQTFFPTATLETLRRRAEIMACVRAFFHSRAFLEVETPILSADTVIDRHLDPFFLDYDSKRYYLQTSPEFAMKRLLAAGAGPIFQIAKVFRRDESGRIHNPEFTMLEYYRPGDDMHAGMDLLDDLQQAVLARGRALRLTYRQAFRQHTGLDPFSATETALARYAEDTKIAIPESYLNGTAFLTKDDWLDLILAEKVQPRLGMREPVILYHYPASQAALAVTDGEFAERFELYADGMELANGYHELREPAELRRRNRQANALRRLDGKDILPDESRLLKAMEYGLPSSSGTAVGFDRMIMVALGAKTLADVLAFPFDRA